MSHPQRPRSVFSSLVNNLRTGGYLLASGLCLLGLTGSAQAQPKHAGTLGFVVTDWRTAILETKFNDECPEGFTTGTDEIWWRGLTKLERAKATNNGKANNQDRYGLALGRGPNRENICLNPTSIVDPPMLIVEGPTSYGMNLDGTADGHPTAKTCAHKKFTAVDGTPNIDNQMYRLLGCTFGWHSYGQTQDNANVNRKTTGFGITAIEVTGVDDPRNDPDVTVNFYHVIDQYALDGTGAFLPFASYRVDMPGGKNPYGASVKGKIENGVLTTEAADMLLPFYGNYTYIDERFRDMRFKLTITPDGKAAKGEAAGYYDVDQLMWYIGGLGVVSFSSQADCPAQYVMAHRLADGYPDPKTGECTALSSAYLFDSVAAFVVHPGDEPQAPRPAGPLHRVMAAFGLEK